MQCWQQPSANFIIILFLQTVVAYLNVFGLKDAGIQTRQAKCMFALQVVRKHLILSICVTASGWRDLSRNIPNITGLLIHIHL